MKEADITPLMTVVEQLRAPNGCPWDRVQTHESMRKYMIEESYEVCDAIARRDDANLCEELGDVLYQIVFHASLARARGAFTLQDVVDGVVEKMQRRHPQIYAPDNNDAPKDWESLKRAEKAAHHQSERLPQALPVTMKLQKLAAKLEKNGAPESLLAACCENGLQRQTLALVQQYRHEGESWELSAQALAEKLEDFLEDLQKIENRS